MKEIKKWFGPLSNVLLILAAGISLYLLVNFFKFRWGQLPGICPINRNRPLIYIAIILALSSFILSLIENRMGTTDN